MGLFRRRAQEKTRQTLGMEGKNFEATSKARSSSTYAELKAYAQELHHYEKSCSEHVKHVNGFNRSTNHFLSIAKPRLHEEHKPGESRALESHSSIGQGVDTDSITVSGVDSNDEIYRGVQEPMKKWLVSFDAITKALSAEEKDRLVVDSRRRTLDKLNHKHDQWSAKKRADDPKLLKLKEDKHKQEVKLQQVNDEFHARDDAVYADMQRLIEDVGPIQAHVARFYELLRNVNDRVVHAFPVDVSKSLDKHPTSSVAGATAKGVNTHANQQMRPEGRVEGAPGHAGHAEHPGHSNVTRVGGTEPTSGVVRPLTDQEKHATGGAGMPQPTRA